VTTEAQHRLDGGLVHPPGRTGIPGPAAPADVLRVRVHVGRHDVGLGPVTFGALRRARVVDRVDHVEQFHRLVALSQPRECDHGPERGVRVLPAILPQAREIALDVPRVPGRAVEGRRQQQHHLRVAADEIRPDRIHGPLRTARLRAPGQHRPRLRQRVDPALLVLHRPERGPVVEVRPPVPVAVPGQFQHAGQPVRLAAVPLRHSGLAPDGTQCRHLPEDDREEPAEPHALTATLVSHPVHPVVPVACAHERKTMSAVFQRAIHGTQRMLEQRRRLGGDRRLLVGVRLLRLEGRRLEEWHRLVENRLVARP